MEGLKTKSFKKGWTSEEVKKLKSLYDGGLNAEEIAVNLGRTRSSVYKAIARFDLTHKSRRKGQDHQKVIEGLNFSEPCFNPKFHNMKSIIDWFRNNSMTSLKVDRKNQTAQLKEINYANEDTRIKRFDSQLELMSYIDDVRKKYGVQIQK